MQNQYPIKVPTFGLEQPVFIVKGVLLQQTTTITLFINIFVTTKLPVYGNGVLIQQPNRANSYP